jgi:hypothetical protein
MSSGFGWTGAMISDADLTYATSVPYTAFADTNFEIQI